MLANRRFRSTAVFQIVTLSLFLFGAGCGDDGEGKGKTPAATATNTSAATATNTQPPPSTDTPTETASPEPTVTDTPAPTSTATEVPTETATPIPTDTATPVPTDTATPIPTDTATTIPTDTPTPLPTDTPTPLPTDTPTALPTDTATETATPLPTETPSATPTETTPPTATPGGPAIILGDVSGDPDDTVAVQVTLQDSLGMIASASVDIVYDSTLVEVVGSGAAPDCTINPAIGAGSAANKMLLISQPGSPPDAKILRIGVISFTNANLIPDGLLLTCNFAIDAAATPGVVVLNNVPGGSDPDGEDVVVRAVDGSITVEPPPPPPFTVGGQCMVPGPGGGDSLVACGEGLRVTVSRCDDRDACADDAGARTLLEEGTTDAAGEFSVDVAADAVQQDDLLLVVVELGNDEVYRTFVVVETGNGGAATADPGNLSLDPISEAAVQLLVENGLEFSNEGIDALIVAVRAAVEEAGTDFSGQTAEEAAATALQVAQNDPDVQQLIQASKFTPTPTSTPEDTGTPTATPTATPIPGPEVNLGSASGMPGQTVAIDVTLANNDNVIASASIDIVYDSSQVNVALSGTAPNCTIEPTIGSGSAVNKMLLLSQPGSPPEAKILRIGVISFTNANIIPNGRLLTCSFVIDAAATLGDKVLTNVPGASDAEGEDVTVGGSNGTITVLAP